MPVDDAAKRMSAVLVSCTWRGGMVQVSLPFAQRHRQAAAYLYSGILAGGAAPVTPTNLLTQRLPISSVRIGL